MTQFDEVLARQKRKRLLPAARPSKHLRADNGYRGEPAQGAMEREGYIPLYKAARIKRNRADGACTSGRGKVRPESPAQ